MTGGKDVKISALQLGFMLVGFLYGSTAIINPAAGGGRDAWLSVIVGWAIGMLLLWMYVTISRLNPGKTLVEILRCNFGTVAGTAVAVLYVWYFIHLAALIMRNFGGFMCTVSYPETPVQVIIFAFTIIVVYAVKKGLETIGRVCEIIVPVIPVIVFIALFALMTISDFSAFRPFLEKGITPVLTAGYGLATFPFGEAVAFLMVFPYVNNRKKTLKAVLIAASATALMFLSSISRDTIIFGPKLLSIITYVPDVTTRLIPNISIEPVVDVNLLVGGGTKTAVCLYAASKGAAEIFRSENYRPLVTALAAFAAVLSMWLYGDVMEMIEWAKGVWPYYSIPFQIGFPAALLVISLVRNRNRKRESR